MLVRVISLAGEDDDRVRMSVSLVDGSRVMGVPSLAALPLQTSFASLDIPVQKISVIRLNHERESATFSLQNGDVLTGGFDIAPLALETMFGAIAISVEHIESINLLPYAWAGGLVLHYTFDNDEDGKVFDVSGNGHHGRIEGNVTYHPSISGTGIKTSSRTTYVICGSPELNLNGWRELTVAAWFKLDKYSTYGRLVTRGADGGGGGGFRLYVGGVYGGNPYHGIFSVSTANDPEIVLRVDRFAQLDNWYHVAGVYDGQKVFYYVNGEVLSTQEIPDGLKSSGLVENKGADLIIGKCATNRTWSDTHIDGIIDEVMIFRRALSAGQIKSLYLSQKMVE